MKTQTFKFQLFFFGTTCSHTSNFLQHLWSMFPVFWHFGSVVQTGSGCGSSKLILRGWHWLWNICCGWWWPHSWTVAAKSTLRSPPQKPNSGPTQGLPWPLLARAFYLWPPEGQRVIEERTLSLAVYVCCTFLVMGCGGSRAEGRGGPGNTLASVLMHVWTPQRKSATERRRREMERKRHRERNLSI